MKLPDIEQTFLIQFITSYLLLGIVLITQFVTYPMYSILPKSVTVLYQSTYIIRAFILIGPLMLIEMLTGIRLAMKVRNFELHRTLRANLSIIAIIWIVTFIFELPSHLSLLYNGFNPQVYTTIIVFNLLRTFLWLIKAIMLTRIVQHFFSPNQVYLQDFLD